MVRPGGGGVKHTIRKESHKVVKLRLVSVLIDVIESSRDNSFDLDGVPGHGREQISSSHAKTIATGVHLCIHNAGRAACRGPWTIRGPTRYRELPQRL